jgi:hypothetical protein
MWHAWEKREKFPRFWCESPKEKTTQKTEAVKGERIKMNLREITGLGCGVGLPGSGYGPVSGFREHGDESSGSGDTKLVVTEECNTLCKVAMVFKVC